VAVAPDGAGLGAEVAAAGPAAVAGREAVEVAADEALVLGVADEAQRHRGNGLHAHEFADLVDHRLATLVPRLHRAAEQAALDAPRHLRQLAVATDEGAGEVGAAADVAPPGVALRLVRRDGRELRAAPALRVFRQRRAGAAQRAHPRQIAAAREVDAGLEAVGVEGGAGAEEGDAGLGREAPQR